ncbi:MAG: hypothetical protein JWN75_275 [Candidatus Saccharibacteria bacterium]|nr:hypothetical protein [Candidatus Saccharibacteria bacterium]
MSVETNEVETKPTTLTHVFLAWLLGAIAVGVSLALKDVVTIICVSAVAIAFVTAISFRWADQPPILSKDD